MTIANLYKKLKQILEDSNVALINKGCNKVNDLYEIPLEITKLGEINRLPYVLTKEIIEVTENDLSGVLSIGAFAFKDCTSLTNITIPNSVTSISGHAFDNCRSLTDMYLYSTTPPTLDGGTDTIPITTTIHVPIGSGDAYRNATNWSSLADKIVEDVIIV